MDTTQAYRRAVDEVAQASLESGRALSFLTLPYVSDILAHESAYLADVMVGAGFARILARYQEQLAASVDRGTACTFDWNEVMPGILGIACSQTVENDVDERRAEIKSQRMRPLTRLERESDAAFEAAV